MKKYIKISIIIGIIGALAHYFLGYKLEIPFTQTIPGTISAFVLFFLTIFFYLYSKQIYSKIFVAMICGACFGYLFGGECSAVISPLGAVFLRLIKMVVVPLVFASLTLGVLSLGDVKKIGRIGGKTIGYYLMTTALAITIGLVLANLIKPGTYINKETKEKYTKQYKQEVQKKAFDDSKKELAIKIGESIAKSHKFSKKKHSEFLKDYNKDIQKNFEKQSVKKVSFQDNLVKIVPDNPLKSMTQGNMLQIIFFALLFGLVLATIPEEKKLIIEKGLGGINDAMITIVTWIMQFAPFGVFALMAKTIAQAGSSILQALLIYMLVVLGGLLLQILLVYSTFVQIFAKISIFEFLSKAKSVLLFAFSTSSSAATLPITMRCAEEDFKVSKNISSFVLPLGATINMDGTALYQGVAAVFIAQVFGIPIGLEGQLTILFTATLASIGTAAVPGAGMIILAMVLEAVNVPILGIALIIGVDRILDMCRTSVNVTGDLSATIFVNATEKKNK